MPSDSPKYLVGLVDPETLTAAESEEFHPSRVDYESCDILEIRYDFFDESEWQGLSARIRKIAPKAIQLGTIRLKRDGGTFPNARAIERPALWKKILAAADIPEWLDLERDCLHDYSELREITGTKGVKILISEHNFTRIPSDLELKNYLTDVKRVKAEGRRHQNCSHEQLRRRLHQALQVRQKGKGVQADCRIRHGRNRKDQQNLVIERGRKHHLRLYREGSCPRSNRRCTHEKGYRQARNDYFSDRIIFFFKHILNITLSKLHFIF